MFLKFTDIRKQNFLCRFVVLTVALMKIQVTWRRVHWYTVARTVCAMQQHVRVSLEDLSLRKVLFPLGTEVRVFNRFLVTIAKYFKAQILALNFVSLELLWPWLLIMPPFSCRNVTCAWIQSRCREQNTYCGSHTGFSNYKLHSVSWKVALLTLHSTHAAGRHSLFTSHSRSDYDKLQAFAYC